MKEQEEKNPLKPDFPGLKKVGFVRSGRSGGGKARYMYSACSAALTFTYTGGNCCLSLPLYAIVFVFAGHFRIITCL